MSQEINILDQKSVNLQLHVYSGLYCESQHEVEMINSPLGQSLGRLISCPT